MSTDPRLLISSGYLFEWLRPALFSLAALASLWVFARLLRRGLPVYVSAACAAAALFSPAVALPLCLALLVVTRGPSQAGGDEGARRAILSSSKRRALVSLYAALVLASGAFHFYRDHGSADAHLARAADAKLRHRPERAAREYEAALRMEDDPHTRKLLALALASAGRHEEALAHLRAARGGGEPDGAIAFHLAAALEALSRHDEATTEYRNFLEGEPCRRADADPRCEVARQRVAASP